MGIQKANETIAGYMGGPYIGDACNGHESANIPMDYCKKDYTCGYCKDIPEHYISLDALIPVWEKLDLPNVLEMEIRQHTKPIFAFRVYTNLAYDQHATCDTIQEAACIATAKTIELLKGSE